MPVQTQILEDFQNPSTLAASFDLRDPVDTPLLDWFFPDAKRTDHPFVKITMEEIYQVLKNVPHSERGVAGYAIEGRPLSQTDFEPKPVIQVANVTVKELRDMETALSIDARTAFVSRFTTVMRDQTLLTIEAMLSSVLSGAGTMTITKNSPMGMYTETFAYGTFDPFTTPVKWDAAGATVQDVLVSLQGLHKTLKDNGYGGPATFRCGKDAWQAAVAVCEDFVSTVNNKPDGPVSFEPGQAAINLYGYKLIAIDESITVYAADGSQTTTDSVDPDIVYAKPENDKNRLYYLKLDRFENGGMSRLMIDVEEKKRALVVESESKPFPIIDWRSVAYSDVMT